MEKEIAVRFYENKKYGSTFGKGLYRKAVFNGTADLKQPNAKYLLDMFSFSDWENTAKTDADMRALELAKDLIEARPKSDWLATWVKRLDVDGSKPRVFGFGLLDLDSNQLTLVISDDAIGGNNVWRLEAKPCKQTATNSPQLLATNAELS